MVTESAGVAAPVVDQEVRDVAARAARRRGSCRARCSAPAVSSIVSANATAGSSTECANKPDQIVPRGADTIPLKSSTFMSSATPNSTKARMTSSAISDSGLKCSRTASSLGSFALRLLVHVLEVDQARRPHVLHRVHVDVDHGRAAARERALDAPARARAGSATRSPCAPIDSASWSKRISPRSVLMVSSGPERLPDQRLERLQRELLVHLHHAPLLVAEHEEDRPAARCAPRSRSPAGGSPSRRRR